jgi:TrkA domain protein
MAEVTETHLPGVGVRYEFTTVDGVRLGVLHHHGGRREIVVYDEDDPDRATSVVELNADDSRTVSELLGATHVTEAVEAMRQQRIEGLTLEWIEVPDRSSMVGRTIGDGELRSRTGASVVAVIRGVDTVPAPGPDHVFAAGDVAVAVGTAEGLELLRGALRS